MNLTIRKAVPDDAHDYSDAHIASWRYAYKGIVPDDYLDNLSVEVRTERFRQSFAESTNMLYLCAVYEEKIVGILIINPSRDEDLPDAGEVSAIYLRPEYIGKGFGRMMMDYAVETLHQQGFDSIIVWALEDNARACRFYEKCGYVADGTKKEINIGKPLTEIRFRKSLQA